MVDMNMANKMVEVLKEEGKYEEFLELAMNGETAKAQAMAEEILSRRRSEIADD